MKLVNPSSHQNPKGWREAYAAFQSFQRVGKLLGEPAHQWQLQYPGSLKERVKAAWKVVYTLNGHWHDAYVGYNAQTAAFGIREVIRTYPRHPRTWARKPPPKAPEKPHPKYDPAVVIKIFHEWKAGIAKVGFSPGSMSEKDFKERYGYHIWLMGAKAGFLDMDMQEYLINHPHGRYWPTPPQNQREFDNRNRELEKIVAEKERRGQERK